MARQAASSIHADSCNWLRIGGLSGTFSIHLGAILLLAIPLAVPVPSVPAPVETVVSITEIPPELPVLPIPDEPQPARITPRRAPVSRPVTPVTVSPTAESAIPVAVPPMTTATDIAPASDLVMEGPAHGSANVTLAYESMTEPRYPPDAKRRGEQGVVLLRVRVGSNGMPQQVDVARSSGSFRLDRAAREAVLRWRFRPVQVDGRAIPAEGLVPIAFHLDRA